MTPPKKPGSGPALRPDYESIYARMAWISEEHSRGEMADDHADLEIKACRAMLAAMRQRFAERDLEEAKSILGEMKHERLKQEARESADRERTGAGSPWNGDPLTRRQ